MAQGRRIEKVSALIRKQMSELLVDGIRDQRLHKGFITITEVELSGDLQYCKIFVSVFGTDSHREEILFALQASTGYLRGELGRRLQMRRAPELVFKLDKGMEKGTSVLNLLGKLEKEREDKGPNVPTIEE